MCQKLSLNLLVLSKKNTSLNQIRFFQGSNREYKIKQLIYLYRLKKIKLLYIKQKITSFIDLNKINFYETKKYWEEIIPKDNYFIIEKMSFTSSD